MLFRSEDGIGNAHYLRAVQTLEEQRQSGEFVWIDPRLRQVKMAGGANAESTLSWLLPVSSIPIQKLPANVPGDDYVGSLVILQRETAAAWKGSVVLTALDSSVSSRKGSANFRVYRVVSSIS